MDNQVEKDTRVQDINEAANQAYIDDVAVSMQRGSVPAIMQHAQSDISQAQADRDAAVRSMEELQALNVMNNQPLMEEDMKDPFSMDAEQNLNDAPTDSHSVGAENGYHQKQQKPNRFTRTLRRVTSPLKKADAFIQAQKQSIIQRQIDYREGLISVQQDKLQREQARMNKIVEKQQAKEAKRQAFKQSIQNSGENLKSTIQNGFSRTGNFVKQAVEKGRGIPRFTSNVVNDVKDGVNESKAFVRDTRERAREGAQSVRERATGRRAPELTDDVVVNRMADRLKEKHVERTHFNRIMKDVHGKDVGYRSLEVASTEENAHEANYMAHLETQEFVRTKPDASMSVEHNSAYYQYMLDMTSEKALSSTDGQMDDHEYRDRAKELYEMLLEEKSETQSKKELNEKLMDSYQTSYPSKRLHLYLAKNPSLTGIDDGLTGPSVEEDMDVSWQYSSDGNEYDVDVSEIEAYDTQVKADPAAEIREKTINKEFNDVPMDHAGYVDTNRESSKVVHLETARMQKEGSVSAVASGKPTSVHSRDMLKGVFRTEHLHSKNAIQQHKQAEQLSLNLGKLDGPEGP